MKFAKPLAKLAVSLLLIAVVVRAFDVRGVGDHLLAVNPVTLALVVVLSLAMAPVHTLRWLIVVHASGNRLAFRQALQMIFIGYFFSQALPSAVGGDALRMWCAYRAGLPAADAVNTVLLDRIIALVGLLLLAAVGLPWAFDLITNATARTAIAMVVAVGLAGYFAGVTFSRATRFLAHWRAGRALARLAALARRITFSPRQLLPLLAISIFGFAVACFIVYAIARSMGLPLSFTQSLLLVPPVLLVSIIPVSIAGWGVREGAMVVALGFVNVPSSAAFAVSVLFGLTIALTSLPGALFWLGAGYSASNLDEAVELAESDAPDPHPSLPLDKREG